MPVVKIGALLVATAFISACAQDPRDYETTPVEVKTKQGTVVCQLYTRERVLWDRAIDRPESMSVRTADDVCRAEGVRRKNAA